MGLSHSKNCPVKRPDIFQRGVSLGELFSLNVFLLIFNSKEGGGLQPQCTCMCTLKLKLMYNNLMQDMLPAGQSGSLTLAVSSGLIDVLPGME